MPSQHCHHGIVRGSVDGPFPHVHRELTTLAGLHERALARAGFDHDPHAAFVRRHVSIVAQTRVVCHIQVDPNVGGPHDGAMADPESIHVHHGFDYVEIPATDLAVAEEFYGAAFGWRFAPYGPGYLGIVTSDGREGGGISLMGTVDRGSIMVVLYSRDLEASFAAVQAAGGEITRQIFDFPGGRRFHFLDPSGNELGVWALAPTE